MKLCECGCGRPVSIAKMTRRDSGHIKGQPVRFIHGHNKAHLGHYKHEINEDFFKFWSPEMAWVLGWVMADGCIDNRKMTLHIGVSQRDIRVLEKIRDAMQSHHPIKINNRIGYGGLPFHSIAISHKNILSDLLKIGLMPKKTGKEFFPAMPESCRRHFIRGLWEGDGSFFKTLRNSSLGKYKLSAEIRMASIDIIQDLGREFTKREIKSSITTSITDNGRKMYRLSLGHNAAVALGYLIYSNIPEELRLERKYFVWNECSKIKMKWNTKKYLAKCLISTYETLGRIPKRSEMGIKLGTPDGKTYFTHYGSWQTACREVLGMYRCRGSNRVVKAI